MEKLRLKLVFENNENPENLIELIFARWPVAGDLVQTEENYYEVVSLLHYAAHTGAETPEVYVRLRVSKGLARSGD